MDKILNFIATNWDALVCALTTVISAIIGIIAAVKTKKWDTLKDYIEQLVREAEKLVNYTGAEKKEYVQTRTIQFAKQKNISYKAVKVSNYIEKLVEISKSVNAREKDKQAAA